MSFLDTMREIFQVEGLPTQESAKASSSSPAISLDETAAGASPVPDPPICPGWLIAYRGPEGQLLGGAEDLPAGTVTEAEYLGTGWRFRVATGTWVSLRAIRSVAKTDGHGKVVAAWEVRAHGFDGNEGAGKV